MKTGICIFRVCGKRKLFGFSPALFPGSFDSSGYWIPDPIASEAVNPGLLNLKPGNGRNPARQLIAGEDAPLSE